MAKQEWIARIDLPAYIEKKWKKPVTLRTIDRWCRDAPTGVSAPLVYYQEGSNYFFKPSDVRKFMAEKTAKTKVVPA